MLSENEDSIQLNIVINTVLRVAICLECHHPILPPSNIHEHINNSHENFYLVDHTKSESLITDYLLKDTIDYPSHPITPVFGIPLLEDPHYFCDKCHCGFHRLTGIQTHQSSNRCDGRSYHQGYGQSIPGHNRRIIEVLIDGLKKQSDFHFDHDTWFRQGIAPSRDYSKIPVPIPENKSNLSAFFYRDGWLLHVEEYTPKDLWEARRTHNNDESYGDVLRKAASRYISDIQDSIQSNVVFGLLKDIGSIDEDKKFSFRTLKGDSVITYSLRLHCLIFNCIQFYVHQKWESEYQYPDLDDSQVESLRELSKSVEDEENPGVIDQCYPEACYSLFAHEKDQYDVSRNLDTNFFSPVICFLVLHCVTETGGTPNSSAISNVIAPIMYAIRTCMFQLLLKESKEQQKSTHVYVFYI
ncbi:MAG: hypothetical protein QOH50_5015 [Kribbellaceae bacterium]|nr:hypothetical protein [Kribbellaceae bacterium]